MAFWCFSIVNSLGRGKELEVGQPKSLSLSCFAWTLNVCTGLSRKKSHKAKVILKTTYCLFSLREYKSRPHLSLLWFVSQMLGDISCTPSVKEIAFIFLFMQKDIAGYFVNMVNVVLVGGLQRWPPWEALTAPCQIRATPAAPKETHHCQSRAMSDAGCALGE